VIEFFPKRNSFCNRYEGDEKMYGPMIGLGILIIVLASILIRNELKDKKQNKKRDRINAIKEVSNKKIKEKV